MGNCTRASAKTAKKQFSHQDFDPFDKNITVSTNKKNKPAIEYLNKRMSQQNMSLGARSSLQNSHGTTIHHNISRDEDADEHNNNDGENHMSLFEEGEMDSIIHSLTN